MQLGEEGDYVRTLKLDFCVRFRPIAMLACKRVERGSKLPHRMSICEHLVVELAYTEIVLDTPQSRQPAHWL